MQVGVDPGTFRAFIFLSGFMSTSPVALGIPPEAGEGWS
jgi:hypothetical protein